MDASVPIPGPLGLGDILDRAFRLYRARFGQLLLAAALFLVPMNILSAATREWYTGALVRGDAGALLVYLLVLLASSWLFAGMAELTLIAFIVPLLHGGAAELTASTRAAWSRLGAYIGYSIVYALLAGLVAGVVMVPVICATTVLSVAGGSGTSALAGTMLVTTGIAMLLVLVAVVFMMARWIVAVPALVVEHEGPVACLRRSWGLTKGNAWRCIGYAILIGILGYLVMYLPSLLLGAVIGATLGEGVLGAAAITIIGVIFSVIWRPIASAAVVLLYFDLRVRREDYDLALRVEQMAAAVGEETGVPEIEARPVEGEEPVWVGDAEPVEEGAETAGSDRPA